MPVPLREVPSLVTLATREFIILTERCIEPYLQVMHWIPDDQFLAPFNILDPNCSRLIIEMLIKHKMLKYHHLKLMLKNGIKEITCDENEEYSPFSLNMLDIISKRCKNFSMIHYHSSVGAPPHTLYLESLLHEALYRMSVNVTEINFTDAFVGEKTMQIICSNFCSLRTLNLHNAIIFPQTFNNLIMANCAFKTTLVELIVDGTRVPFSFVCDFLLHFQNLLRFVSDETIRCFSCMSMERVIRQKREDMRGIYFKTSVLKQNFESFNFLLDDRQVSRGAKNLKHFFPLVNHLIMTVLTELSIPLNKNIILTLCVSELELSGYRSVKKAREFADLISAFDEKVCHHLKSLTLENFYSVDIYYLGIWCQNLKKLILINNTYKYEYKKCWEPTFSRLKEVECILLRDAASLTKEISFHYYINHNSLFSLLSSRELERVVIVDHIDFGYGLDGLLEAGLLRSLKELSCFKCTIRGDVLAKLFEKDLPIQKLEVSKCYINDTVLARIHGIIRNNNYATVLKVYDHIPYRLRWSLVEIPYFIKNGEMLH